MRRRSSNIQHSTFNIQVSKFNIQHSRMNGSPFEANPLRALARKRDTIDIDPMTPTYAL